MTPHDFLIGLEMDLRYRGVPFDGGELGVFVADAWPLIEEDPDVARWAMAFLCRPAVSPHNFFPEISNFGESCHAARMRLLDYDLAFDEPGERSNVYLNGPDLGEQFARPNATVTGL